MSSTSDDDLPHYVYLTLWTDRTAADVASLFAAAGWSARMCAWSDYEVTLAETAELVIEAEAPVLMHGPIRSASTVVPLIRALLDQANILHSFDAYDESDELLMAVTEEEIRAKRRSGTEI